VLLGSVHYHFVPVVVVAAGVGDAAVAAAGDAADTDSAVGAVAAAAVGAAAAGTDAVAAAAAAAVDGGVAAAAVVGNHRAGFGGIAVVPAEDEEEPAPAVCVDSPAAVKLAPETAVVAERTELEAAGLAGVAALGLAVAAALAAAGNLEQVRALVLTSARQQPAHQRDCLQLQG
jgi:hypothetical protein